MEADGEDCGGPEPARNSDPDEHLQPDTDDKTQDSSKPETEDSDGLKATREPQSGLNCQRNDEVPVNDEESFSCSDCDESFTCYEQKHMMWHEETGPFTCSVCGKNYVLKKHLIQQKVTELSSV